MSRCFSYPPPGYAGKCASNEALICTIKLQRESEKTKSEKNKDRRKEKKERKREDKENGIISSEKKKKILKDEKMYDADIYAKYPEVGQFKQQESSYELMEKSSLTEEHGKPCCSSDSTENSGKRKRQSPPHPSNNNARNSGGTVIRIVLNSRKKDDCPTSTSSKTASLSLKTGKVDSLSQKTDVTVETPASKLRISPPKINSTQQLAVSSKKEKIPCPKSNSIQKLTVSSNKEKLPGKSIDQGSTSKEKKLPRPLRKYNALFENFVLPSMEVEAVNEDDDWLFGSKKEEVCQPSKRSKLCKEEVVNCGIPALQPKAQFLGDVDIYALPFTVPF